MEMAGAKLAQSKGGGIGKLQKERVMVILSQND